MGIKVGRRTSKAWVLGATLSVAILAAASLASGAGLKTKSESTTVSFEGSVTPKCGKGTKAVSGGFDSVASLPDDVRVLPYESRRVGGRKWTTSARNIGSNPGVLTGFVYCADRKGIKQRSDTVAFSASASRTPAARRGTAFETAAVAKCKRGETVLSGGFSSPGDDQVAFPVESRRLSKREWGVTWSPFVPMSLTAYAVCQKDAKKPAQATASISSIDNGGNGTATATCPKGTRVISGGFDQPDFAPPGTGILAPVDSLKAGKRGWRVTAHNYGPAPADELVAYAYCEKKRKKK
jgi:hypothetical protein